MIVEMTQESLMICKHQAHTAQFKALSTALSELLYNDPFISTGMFLVAELGPYCVIFYFFFFNSVFCGDNFQPLAFLQTITGRRDGPQMKTDLQKLCLHQISPFHMQITSDSYIGKSFFLLLLLLYAL